MVCERFFKPYFHSIDKVAHRKPNRFILSNVSNHTEKNSAMKTNGQPEKEKRNLMKASLTILFLIFALNIFGQIQPPKTPTIQNFDPIVPGQNSLNQNSNTNSNRKPHGTELYEKDKQEQQHRQQHLNNICRESDETNANNVSYTLPSCAFIKGVSLYQTAFYEIMKMAEIQNEFSIAKANFIVENAYYENPGNYQNFEKTIREIGQFLNWKMQEYVLDSTDNLAKNMLLFRFFTDTLEIKSKNLKHYPFTYDFEDYPGKEDWSKIFVSKALMTNSGQCHSLPLLYLIIAEKIGAEAQLAYSPRHTYIKFKDNTGKWYNVELTNGMMTTDAFILQSGYIKSETLRNKIYMQPLNKNQLLSLMLFDLAKGYTVKYCYDEFVEKVIDEAIRLDSTNIVAQALKSDFLTIKFDYISKQLGITEQNYMQKLAQYPQAKQAFITRNKQYDKMDNLGYQEMPADAYEKWLNSLNEAHQKQQSEQIFIDLNKKIEIKKIELRK